MHVLSLRRKFYHRPTQSFSNRAGRSGLFGAALLAILLPLQAVANEDGACNNEMQRFILRSSTEEHIADAVVSNDGHAIKFMEPKSKDRVFASIRLTEGDYVKKYFGIRAANGTFVLQRRPSSMS